MFRYEGLILEWIFDIWEIYVYFKYFSCFIGTLICWSVFKSCLTLYDPMDCSKPGFLVLHCLLEFAQTHVHWVSDVIQLSHPLLPPFPPALILSQHQGLFQWLALGITWPKYWSFRFSISPLNECSGLISFRIDWFDLAIQGALKIDAKIMLRGLEYVALA